MEPAPAALTLWCRNTAGRPAAGEGAVAPVTAGQVQGEGEGEEGMKQFEGKAPKTKQNNKEGEEDDHQRLRPPYFGCHPRHHPHQTAGLVPGIPLHRRWCHLG